MLKDLKGLQDYFFIKWEQCDETQGLFYNFKINSWTKNENMRIKYYNLFIRQIGIFYMISINLAINSVLLYICLSTDVCYL